MSTKKKTKSTSERKSPSAKGSPTKKSPVKKPPSAKKPSNERPFVKFVAVREPLPAYDWSPMDLASRDMIAPAKELIDSIWSHASLGLNSNDSRKNAVIALRDLAIYATDHLAYLYAYGDEGTRQLVEEVALEGREFVQKYSLMAPFHPPEDPEYLTMGDEIRQRLTKRWGEAHLKVKKKDTLEHLIQRFYVSVRWNDMGWWDMCRERARERGEDFPPMVSEEVRLELCTHRDPRKWAKALVDFYEKIRPWPYRDGKGRLTAPTRKEVAKAPIKYYIHKLAWARLMSRQGSDSHEKSPLVAMREVVRDRFRSYFRNPQKKKVVFS